MEKIILSDMVVPFQKWRCVCHIRKSQLDNAADDGNGGCENGDDVKKDQVSYMRVS